MLTGGTGPIIDFGVDQSAGYIVPGLPRPVLDVLAKATGAVKAINTFLGDGGSSILLDKDFGIVRADQSSGTRADSAGTSFGVDILATKAIATIGVAAKGAIGKRGGGGGVPNGNRASNPANAPALNAQLAAQEVANGHAFDKHVLGQGNPSGKNEFADLGISTKPQFQNFVENIVNTVTDVRTGSFPTAFIPFNTLA